jgi:hypothetical protein
MKPTQDHVKWRALLSKVLGFDYQIVTLEFGRHILCSLCSQYVKLIYNREVMPV